jgi:tRNA threonylcarbamoyl adenosine modification protein (Sua5/YciO/YrdC/YwlC family)
MLVLDASTARERSIVAAASAARRGDVLLVPTESSYALATDAFSARGVEAIRDAKGLPGNAPLAVMVPAPATLSGLALHVGEEARQLAEAFWPGPLTLLVTPQPTLAWPLPGDALLAVRMPLHPVLLALLSATGPLVVTGLGARATTVEQAQELQPDGVQFALDAGELSMAAVAPTIVDVSGPQARLVREGDCPVEALARVCAGLAPHGA